MTPEQLQKYWDDNPEALQQSVEQNPLAFLSGALRDSYGQYAELEDAYNNKSTLQGNLAGEDFAYVPGGRVQGLLTGGAYLPEKQQLGSQRAFQLIEESGLPLINEQGLGLNTGFSYARDGMRFNPGEGAVGEYNIAPVRTGSSSANFMTDVGIPMLLSTVAGPLAPTLGPTGAAAFAGGLQGATSGEGVEGILKSAATSGITSGISNGMFKDVLPNAFGAENVAGSFLRGASSEVINQAIMDGKISLEDALKAGLINSAVDVGKDVYKDALQTRSAQEMLDSGMTLDGSPVSLEDALRLENTSDMYGLLGENGLLGKAGLDVGYLPTDWIGKGADLLKGFGPRTTAEINGKEYRILQDPVQGVVAVNPDGTINTDISVDDINAAYGAGLVTDTRRTGNVLGSIFPDVDVTRYDERYFDITTDRSSDARMSGIWENNPFLATGGVFTGFPSEGGVDGGLPSEGLIPPNIGGEDDVPSLPKGEDAPDETVTEELEKVGDQVLEEIEDGLDSGDNDLEKGDTDFGPFPSDGSLPDPGSTGSIEDNLPSKGGSGGTGGDGEAELPKLPSGMMGGAGDFKAFMSNISYVLPVIQQMGIPFEDFMKMWMRK